MIIDFHTHTFPDKIAPKTIAALERVSGITAATDGTLNGLLHSMEQADVSLSVIQPVVTKPAQFETINLFAAETNRRYAGKLLSFGGIHPDCENYKEKLDWIKSLGLPGIKLHPDYQGVMIDDVRYMNIIEYADSLGLIILTHAGIDIGLPEPVHCPPAKMRKVLDCIKPSKMVLAHYGGWKQWEDVAQHLAGERVWFDTSFTFDYIDREDFLALLQRHGSDRLLFATDSPWSSVADAINYVKELPLSEDAKDAILYRNAQKLLKLSE